MLLTHKHGFTSDYNRDSVPAGDEGTLIKSHGL